MSIDLAGHICRHCRKRLPFGSTSTICRKCRFNGHRQFGDCVKCPTDVPVANLSLADKINELGKLS